MKTNALSFAPPGTYIGQRLSESRAETYRGNAEDRDLRYGLFSPTAIEEPFQSSDTARSSTPHRRPTPEIPTTPIQYIVNDSNACPMAITATAPSYISREPIHYKPSKDTIGPKSEPERETRSFLSENTVDSASQDSPRSLRPGQKGFAERLMSKYGWTKGAGLGASESGIVNPLRVQVEKQRKKPDSEGGGVVGHGGKGKILGGASKGGSSAKAETGRFGIMSEVVILLGMVDGMDLDLELEGSGDGGLMQEIGDECGDKVRRPTFVPLSFSFGVSNYSSMAGWRGFILIEVALKSLLSSSNLLASCLLCVYDPLKRNGLHIAHPFLGRECTRREGLQRQQNHRQIF